MKILLVDDSLLVRNTIKRMYKEMRLSDALIFEAKDGKTGLELFDLEKPDLLIVDLLMPVIDGEEVVLNLQYRKHNCFIAVLTSNIQKPVRERLIRLGANLFVEKPITINKLETIMNAYKEKKEAE